MIKEKVAFWRAGYFPANQGFSKTFQFVLIGWIKAGPPKKSLLFWSCEQAKRVFNSIWSKQKWLFGRADFFSANQSIYNTF